MTLITLATPDHSNYLNHHNHLKFTKTLTKWKGGASQKLEMWCKIGKVVQVKHWKGDASQKN